MGTKTKGIKKEKVESDQLERRKSLEQDDYASDWPQEKLKDLLLDRIADDSKGISSQEEYQARRLDRFAK